MDIRILQQHPCLLSLMPKMTMNFMLNFILVGSPLEMHILMGTMDMSILMGTMDMGILMGTMGMDIPMVVMDTHIKALTMSHLMHLTSKSLKV